MGLLKEDKVNTLKCIVSIMRNRDKVWPFSVSLLRPT